MQMSVSEYLLYLFRKEPKNQNLNTKILVSKFKKYKNFVIRNVYAFMRRAYAQYMQSIRINAQNIRKGVYL